MKRTPVLLMPAAERDLDEQYDYIALLQDSERAERLIEALDQTLDVLSRHPRMGRVANLKGSLMEGARMFRISGFPKHPVFYRIGKRGVEVLRIVHGARDIETLFED